MIKMIASEPISLTEAKLHLRLTDIEGDPSEDTLILDLISSAREYCEQYTGRNFPGKTYEYYLDEFPDIIELPEESVNSIMSIIYKDEEEKEATVDSSSYILSEDNIALLEGNSWPVFVPYAENPIKITFKTGTVPHPVKQAMLLLIGHWYTNREAIGEVTNKSIYSVQVPFSVKSLLDQYRDRWWD